MHRSKISSKSPMRFKKQTKTKEDIIHAHLKSTISSAEPFEEYEPSKGLFEAEQDVEGKELFKVAPLKPKRCIKESSEDCMSAKQSSTNTASPEQSKSKYSLRQTLKRELRNMKIVESVESDPEDTDENLSEDSELDDNDFKITNKSTKTFSETYFSAQKHKKSTTSNRTLSHLKLKQIDLTEMFQIISGIHLKEKKSLLNNYKTQFLKWNFLLHEGFNIMVYGIGSKRKILDSFCKECLESKVHIVVHGFSPFTSLKQVLTVITEEVLEIDKKFPSIDDHSEFIRNHFSKGSEELYVIVHNMDGMPLRSVKTQTTLSGLAACENIHFICSVDHINSPLMWSQTMLSQFRWVWEECTTFDPYILETSHETSLFPKSGGPLLLSSLLHVTHSLTENGRKLFLILAEHQKNTNTGLSFSEWYQECREAFLVNSEITMQAQLSEFKNHKLLSSKKSLEGIELWHIPVDSATLDQFLISCK